MQKIKRKKNITEAMDSRGPILVPYDPSPRITESYILKPVEMTSYQKAISTRVAASWTLVREVGSSTPPVG
jgi:hypothetical protein